MVLSVKDANVTKEHIQDVASALMQIMHDCAIRRDCYVKTPESQYYNYTTNGYEVRSFGISEIAYLRATNARLVVTAICDIHNLNWFKSYIGYFSGNTCKDMILAYIGANWYWRDYYNRFKSLAAYGNSLIGKEVKTGFVTGVCIDWHYTHISWKANDTRERAKYTLLLDILHTDRKGANKVFPLVTYELGRYARDHIKAYTRAWDNNTVKWGPNGIYQYPAHYALDLKIGRPLYDNSFYGYHDAEYDASARLGNIASYELLERYGYDHAPYVRYTLESGKEVTRKLPPNMYIMHEEC